MPEVNFVAVLQERRQSVCHPNLQKLEKRWKETLWEELPSFTQEGKFSFKNATIHSFIHSPSTKNLVYLQTLYRTAEWLFLFKQPSDLPLNSMLRAKEVDKEKK